MIEYNTIDLIETPDIPTNIDIENKITVIKMFSKLERVFLEFENVPTEAFNNGTVSSDFLNEV